MGWLALAIEVYPSEGLSLARCILVLLLLWVTVVLLVVIRLVVGNLLSLLLLLLLLHLVMVLLLLLCGRWVILPRADLGVVGGLVVHLLVGRAAA